MPLEAGRNLGPYKIVDPIGKGGMGEVYRARDTKLDRDVAIKALPEEFAQDDERLARFEREAKLLAQLNHPNIASIHGFEDSDGVKALVLELVEGPTLAERIAEGPIPVDEAIAIAKQIAEALEAGHEAGVIHRDLKPANIKLKEDGTVKVLDYGLAKALEGEVTSGTDSELSQSPTLTRQGTQVGVILGTAAYMSPEQAKGKRVDTRADVWAFGAVLYEMLTGRRAFSGEDISDTLAAVLRADPDWGRLPADLSPIFNRFLRLCLVKEPRRRLQAIADFRLALDGSFDGVASGARELGPPIWGLVTAAALIGGLVVGSMVWLSTRTSERSRSVSRFALPFQQDSNFAESRRFLDVSPDGTRLVYVSNGMLYMRSMDDLEAIPIRGTELGRSPVVSPNGEWVAFHADEGLKKVALTGGATVTLSSIDVPSGASWDGNDSILVALRNAGIERVPASGGPPALLFEFDAARGAVASPQMLPGGEVVLFTIASGADWNKASVIARSLEDGTEKVLIRGARDARYVPTGHLVYMLDRTLLAVAFDTSRLEVSGTPTPIVEGIWSPTVGSLGGAGQFDVSDTGTLVYVSGRDTLGGTRRLLWVDRAGREVSAVAESGLYIYPRVSPDGRRIAVWDAAGDSDLWTWDVERETMTRFTFAPGRDSNAVWSPDGARIAFTSGRNGSLDVYWKAADGQGSVERLTTEDDASSQYPYAFTPDGSQLLVLDVIRQNRELSLLGFDGTRTPLLAGEFNERNGEFSPDGRWLAFQSNESGRNEVYVRPFPDVDGGLWLVSNDGGTRPLWAPNGRELFYTSAGGSLMSVPVETEPTFSPGRAEALFGGHFAPPGAPTGRTYDISSDGKRFLIVRGEDDGEDAQLVVVQNWFRELERLVPTQ